MQNEPCIERFTPMIAAPRLRRSFARRRTYCVDRFMPMIAALAALAQPVLALAQEHHQPAPHERERPRRMQHMQHMNGMERGFAGIPDSREASGTSWQPDSTPVHGSQQAIGLWKLMLHYNAFLSFDHQSGPRGADQVNGMGWYMAMATRPLGRGELMLRAMLSPEPATVGPGGYPLLFQSGEARGGKPLVDRQHPHDLFMELAARYRRPVARNAAVFLYVAPSGEPALGPVAFPHRASAMNNPAAPLSHHWQDSTHISFGVLTAGVSSGKWQAEGSWFNGREPDERRWNFDPIRLDSFSGRVSVNPSPNWSLQASYGWLKDPEPLHPGETRRRTTFSASYAGGSGIGGPSASFVWGRNNGSGANTDSFLIEGDYPAARRVSLFGRVEYVEKLGEDLALLPAKRKIPVTAVTFGALHELTPNRPYDLGLGAAVTWTGKPRDLDALYGRSPVGVWVFLRLRPALHAMENRMH